MSFIYKIKQIIPLDVKMRFDSWKNPGESSRWAMLAKSDRQVVYIFLAGFYQNLGDMAITLAQREFIKAALPDADIVWISNDDTYRAIRVIKRFIKSTDLITVIGGGNMSDSYIHLETQRRHVVKSFQKNRVVLFPQTMFYNQTRIGVKEQQISKTVYQSHPDLIMFARENNSYNRMKVAFPTVNVCLAPDIVLSLNKREPVLLRKGVLCCIRSDKESDFTEQQRTAILSAVEEKYSNVMVTDTVDVSKEECTEACFEATLNEFWNKIKMAELVVTDRLHCMIFCAITNTPCIAIDNANQKVSGVYHDWLEAFEQIHLVSKEEAIPFIINYSGEVQHNINTNAPSFEKQFETLREMCEGRKI